MSLTLKKKSKASTGRSTQTTQGPRIQPVSSLKFSRSYLFYGRSGTGKTTLASTFPGKILFLDVNDRGLESVADVPDVDCSFIRTFRDLENLYYVLEENPTLYKTVVIDTVSQLQNLVIAEHLANKSGSNAVMTMRDWGSVSALMKEWLANYRDLSDLGIEVIFLAQDRVDNGGDEDTQDGLSLLDPEIGPALSPGTAKALNASVSIIGNTFILEKVRVKKVEGRNIRTTKKVYCLGLGPSSLYVRKAQKPKSISLPDFIEDPTYEELIDTINGE